MRQYKYLDPKYEEQLAAYQYSGIDHSVLYKYIMSPIANVCLEPNVITLLGLLCVVVPHIMLWVMYPVWEFNVQVHPAMMVFLGISHLVYMNFDNLDGKQARKTGNSSPLGLLFDHGCDSLIVFIQGISLATCLRFNNDYSAFLVVYLGAFTFFTTTIEEYYTQIMYLPCVNGAAEGCFGLSILYFITAVVGGDYWSQQTFGITNRILLLGGFCLAGAGNLIGIIMRIYASNPQKLKAALIDMGFFFFITFACSVAVIYGPQGGHYLRLIIYIFGFNFAKLVSILQICHVSNSPFEQFRQSNFFILVILLLNTCSHYFLKSGLFNDFTVLSTVLVASLAAYSHLVYYAIEQFCEVLCILPFTVKQDSNYDFKFIRNNNKGLYTDPVGAFRDHERNL